jgi:hypothetical protein
VALNTRWLLRGVESFTRRLPEPIRFIVGGASGRVVPDRRRRAGRTCATARPAPASAANVRACRGNHPAQKDLPAARINPASAWDTRLRRPVSGGVHDGDLRLWGRPPKRATLIVGTCLGRST